MDVWDRQHWFAFFRPFDDADSIFVEMFAETGVKKLLRPRHPIEIEVDNGYHAVSEPDFIRFGQRVGRTFDATDIAGGMQQRARERGLAGAEVAVQVNRHAGFQHLRQCRAQRCGTGFVLQVSMMGWLHILC